MRIIGHIPNQTNAGTFSDYLYVQGIANQVEQEKDGWAVWIHSEDEMEKAKALLNKFLANPNDPAYQQQARQATKLKEREVEEQEEAAKRYFDRDRTFAGSWLFGLAPLTGILIVLSILVTVLYSFRIAPGVIDGLLLYGGRVLHGEVWRLVTPIFLHANLLSSFGVFHLFFNVLWLYNLGSAVERSRGTGWFLAFVLVIAVFSNLAQALMSGPMFGGLSGVVYGLLGYIWMKGKFDPNSELVLPSQTVTMMLLWYFLCLLMPNIANTVHTVGLLTGMAWGYLSSLNPR